MNQIGKVNNQRLNLFDQKAKMKIARKGAVAKFVQHNTTILIAGGQSE